MHKKDVTDLKIQIFDWQKKYDQDVNNVQREYQKLLDFTDVEREINMAV